MYEISSVQTLKQSNMLWCFSISLLAVQIQQFTWSLNDSSGLQGWQLQTAIKPSGVLR